MADINAELDAFLATTKPQDPATGAEATKLQQGASQVVAPPAPLPPSAASAPAPEINLPAEPVAAEPAFDPNAELDAFLANSQGLPATETPQVIAPQPDVVEGQLPGWGEIVSGGIKRGVAQVASMPADLVGIAAEAGGDQAAAQAAFEKARAIEAYAPKGYYNFEDIHDFDSFAGWMVEGLAEQAPVMASLLTGAGVGGLGARLIAKGLIKNPNTIAKLTKVGAGTGAFGVGAGLETAGAGSEFKQRTGSYDPERALAVGVANGLLESYGPAKLFSAGARSLREEVFKGVAREGLTEAAQEINTAANAAWIDENYDFFSRETTLRVAEATLLGGVAGGITSGAVRGAQRLTGTEPAPIVEEELDPANKDTWRTGLTVLRDKLLTRRSVNNDNILQFPVKPSEDVFELSTVFNGVRKTWEREGINEQTIDEVKDFEDAVTDRYVMVDSLGKVSSELYTATDLEEVMALRPPQEVQKLVKVDLRELSAGGITADPFDLPTQANDKRIFFAPWVKPEMKEALLERYTDLGVYVQQYQANRLQNGESKSEARQALLDLYAPLAAAGLRVVPSRGASFIYKGEVTGTEVTTPELGARSPAVMLLPRMALQPQSAQAGSLNKMAGITFTTPKEPPRVNFRTVETDGYIPVTLDGNKVDFDEVIVYPIPSMLDRSLSKYMFKKGLSESTKVQLVEDYIALMQEAKAQSFVPVQFRKQLVALKDKGIQAKINYADEFKTTEAFTPDKLKKLIVGRFTPGIELGPDRGHAQRVLSIGPEFKDRINTPEYSSKGVFVDLGLSTPTPFQQKAIDKIKEYVPLFDKMVAKFGLPPLDVKIISADNISSSMAGPYLTINLKQIFEKTTWNDRTFILGNKENFEASILNLMLHEVGHYVTILNFKSLPFAQQNQIIYAYEKARLRNSILMDVSPVHHQLGDYVEFQSAYALTFLEFIAEQFRRYALQSEVFNPAGVFYRKTSKQLGKIKSELEQALGVEKASNIFTPYSEFHSAMRYLEQVTKEANEYNQRKMQKAGIVQAQFGVAETIPVVEESLLYGETVKLVEAWRQALPKDVEVEVVPTNELGPATATYTSKDPLTGKATIRLWVGAQQKRGASNPIAHEAVHAIWHLLTAGERRTLTRAGRNGKVMPAGFESKYFSDYKRQLKALNFNEQEAVTGARQYVDEEYAAWLVGKRFNGVDFGLQVNTILDSLIDLFNKVTNLLTGNGWTSPEAIMRALYRGEIAGRVSRRPVPPPSVTKGMGFFSDVRDTFKAKALDRLPPDTVQQYESAKDFEAFFDTRFKRDDGGSVTVAKVKQLATKAGLDPEAIVQELRNRRWNTQLLAGGPRFIGLAVSDAAQIVDGGKAPQVSKTQNVNELEYLPDNVPLAANDAQIGIVKSQYEDNFNGEEVRVHSLGGNIYVLEEILWEGHGREFTFVQYNGPVKGTKQAKLARLNGGERIGKIDLSRQGKLGYEVDMVNIHDKFKFKNSKVAYSDQFYKWLESYLQQEMRPSGILYDPGYKMWKRRNPASVAYHQWDEVGEIWYSPKRILKLKTYYEAELSRLEKAKAAGQPTSKPHEAGLRTEANKYRRLYGQVPKEAWTDPGFEKSFMSEASDPGALEAYLGMLKKEGEVSDARFEKAISGQAEHPTVDPFMAAVAENEKISKAKNARILQVDEDVSAPASIEGMVTSAIIDRWGQNNPTLNPMLSGQSFSSELDRINWFTKLAISIKQMAWNNPHIQQLRDYVAAKDEMNAMRMAWIERAEDTVKAWDTLAAGQRDALADLLFWATEMQYLPANTPPRLPTQQEIAAQAQALGLGQSGLQMYYRVQKDFSDYLVAVEQVLSENIRKQNIQVGSTGVITISPAGQTALASLQADMAAMRMRPYFPMVRFGEYTVTVRDPGANNAVVWFSAYPSIRERDAAAIQIGRRFPAHRMQVGRMEPDVMQFQGLPPTLLRAIKANLPGLTQQQSDAIDKFALQMAPERSFKKRWLKRSGTQGYSLDGMRVYAHYFQGASGYLAKLAYKPVMDEAISGLKSTLPLMRDATKRAQIARFMERDQKYSMEPSRDWHKFRSAVSLWQLGFSPAAAFINFTQTPIFTLPYFAGIYGQRANMLLSTVAKSTKRAISYSPAQADPQFAAVRKLLVQMGKLETGAAPELGAYAEGGNLLGSIAGTRTQRAWRSFARTSMWMFQQAERVNREIVLGLGWELSTDPSHPHLQEIANQHQLEILKLANTTVDIGGQPVRLTYDNAVRLVSIREAISRTQFEYSRDYRPPFLRSPLASSFLVFFGYMQSALYAFGNNPGTMQLFLTFVFLFGAMGLPGAEDLEEVVTAVARKMFGKDFSLEHKARELVHDLTQGTVFDEVGADLLLHGVSKLGFGLGLLEEGFGTPRFDASANGSMGQIVPGLAATARAVGRGDDWKSVTAELAKEASGAGFGQIFPMMQFLGGIASGDVLSADWKKWESVMPRAMKAMSKAGRYAVEGEDRGRTGATLAEFDVRDPDDLATIIAQGFGFTPTKISSKWDVITAQQDSVKFYQSRKTALMLQFYEATRRKDRESKQEVVKSIQSYNRELKALGLQSLSITSDGLKQSMKQRTTAMRKQELGLPAQTSATPLFQKMEELFPLAEKVK